MDESSAQQSRSISTGKSGKERRRTPRFELKTGVQWRLADGGGDWLAGELMDLSVAGAGFVADGDAEEGARISLKVEPPLEMEKTGRGSLKPVLVKAVVRNRRPVEGSKMRFGVEFDRMYFLFGEWARVFQSANDE